MHSCIVIVKGGARWRHAPDEHLPYTIAGAVSQKTTRVAVSGTASGNFDQSFTQSFAWNDLGALAAQDYPSLGAVTPARTVYNTYTNGFLTSVEPYYATGITYHANGMVASVGHSKRAFDVASGVSETQSIDNGLGGAWMARPTQLATSGATLSGTGGSGDWSTGTYSYDGVGNIKTMGADAFHYDKVSRLTSATLAGPVNEAYGYDLFGNMTSYNGTSRPVLGTTNRLSAAGYDNAGNMTSGSGTGYTYDPLNQLRTVTGSGINRRLAYDADGERIVVRDFNTTTVTLRDLAGKLVREITFDGTTGTWSWNKDYVYRDGLLLASVGSAEGIRHYHLDHLGSTRMLTNRCGERYKLLRTTPFGLDISGLPQDGERRRFTGHERDLGMLDTTADDLDYMHARYYGPLLARFLSANLLRGDTRRPQSFNLFGYVSNNPINLVDPLGLMPVDQNLPVLGENGNEVHCDGPDDPRCGLAVPVWLSPWQRSIAERVEVSQSYLWGDTWYAPVQRFERGPFGRQEIASAFLNMLLVEAAKTDELVALDLYGGPNVPGIENAYPIENLVLLGAGFRASGLKFFARGGSEWHVGLETAAHENLFHLGRSTEWGVHFAVGAVRPFVAKYHLYVMPYVYTYVAGRGITWMLH